MNDLLYSTSTMGLCTIGYYFSWKYYSKHHFVTAVLLLVACGFALRMYTASDLFLHPWDERYHALVAKNLINQPLIPTLYNNPILPYDYKNWATNHIWLHKQPLPLWTMSLSLGVFGINEIALRLPSIFLSSIGIYLLYFIGAYFFNKKIGYLAAFLFSINGLIIELAAGRVATDHVDIFFLFFIELAIVLSILFVKHQKMVFNVLAGISIGAAILSKWLPALIVLPIWLLIVIDSKKYSTKSILVQFTLLLVACICTFLPWQLYIYHAFPDEAGWATSHNLKHITETLDERTGSIFYFFNRMRINYGELIHLPFLWFLWKTFTNLHNKKLLAITIWVVIPLLFFSFVKTKMQAYILFIAPALFLMTADFFYMILDYQIDQKFKLVRYMIILLLLALPMRYMIERVKPFQQNTRNPDWAIELRKLNEKNISKGVILNYERSIEAMFYTNLISYQYLPERDKIIQLVEKGYTVIINDNGKLPENIKTIKGINIERIKE